MRRYIVLLLITGIVWAQTDFDKLVLKDGTTYLGEYSKTEGGKVFFILEGANSLTQVVPVKLIKKLQLNDGPFIILDGRNRLTLEEYQKLSTKEKGIYDAKSKGIYDAKSKNLGKWALFGPISTILFLGLVFELSKLEYSLAASLTIPYFILNINEKFNFPKSILNITDSEKRIYKQAYSKELRKRKFIYAAVSTIATVVTFAVVVGPPPNFSNSGGGGTPGKGFTGFGP